MVTTFAYGGGNKRKSLTFGRGATATAATIGTGRGRQLIEGQVDMGMGTADAHGFGVIGARSGVLAVVVAQ